MNWKLTVAMVVSGIFVVCNFYWGNHSVSFSALSVDGAALAAMDGASPAEDGPEEAEEEALLSGADTYYREELSDRYEEYRLQAPELDGDTVVWHVNAGLDLEPYAEAWEAEDDHPLLVNKQHKLPEDYQPELVEIHSGILATPGTAEAFQRMRAAAMKDGIYIEAAGGYRSLERQRELFETEERYYGTEAAEESVARPGYGEHSTGRALHIVDRDYTFDGFETLPEYAWLMEHCTQYGFILRYGQDTAHITGFAFEPYHFTFVGEDIARDMRELEIGTLEEYAAKGLDEHRSAPIDDRIAVVIYTGDGGTANGLATQVKDYLERESLRVVLTGDSRDIENETKAAVLVGIGETGWPGGAVAWFDSGRQESRVLAETVGSRLAWSGAEVVSRGIDADEMSDLARLTAAPAVFIEPPDQSGGTAKAIADAITAHLGVRKMYLTFDDGPNSKNTPQVLAILREKGVKATFFVIGEMAEQHPELLQQIADEGHTIGIHCYNHDYNQLYASVDSFLDDFYRARAVVEDITGIAPVIYRFPGGSINNYNKAVYAEIIQEMNRRGFVYYDWNMSVEDALGSVQPGQLMNNVKEYSRSRHAVLLMHDAYSNIVVELGDIINYFSDYRMEVIDGDTAPVQFK